MDAAAALTAMASHGLMDRLAGSGDRSLFDSSGAGLAWTARNWLDRANRTLHLQTVVAYRRLNSCVLSSHRFTLR